MSSYSFGDSLPWPRSFLRTVAGWFCVLAVGVSLAAAARTSAPLNDGWRFHLGDLPSVVPTVAEADEWDAVTLPHTWNAADGADGGDDYRRTTGWYVRRLFPAHDWAGRRVVLECPGAGRRAAVFLNGHLLGEHVGAYATFRLDLTEALIPGRENVLAIRVNNAADGTPPVSADFTFFGGLYRGIRIITTDEIHVATDDRGADGITVRQRDVSAAAAQVTVVITAVNDSRNPARLVVRTQLEEADGRIAATSESPLDLAGAARAVVPLGLTVPTPRLWQGRRDPYLYTLRVATLVDGRVTDELTRRIGLRSFRLDPDRGFFLNGEYLDLRGASRHQDRPGQGTAISEADDREDFALLMELGATAVRVAHYPQSDLWFDLADQLGLVAWAEIPVVNEVPGTATYANNARQQLRELIHQHGHRPAICFWGIGNETREQGETAGNHRLNGPEAIRLLTDLAALAKAEDPTRPTVYASYHKPEDRKNSIAEVLGYNKYIGWYSGRMEDFGAWADQVHALYPTVPLGISEYGAGGSIHQHEANPKKPVPAGAWHPEEYQTRFHEVHWAAMRARPYLWAKFIWNLCDFAADQRAEGDHPGINDKGLVTYDRQTRKDAFYFYKAQWSDAPVLHLVSRRFNPRTDASTEIQAYTNAESVELWLDGVSQGVRRAVNGAVRWAVTLRPGESHALVRAVRGDVALSDECVWTLQSAPTP